MEGCGSVTAASDEKGRADEPTRVVALFRGKIAPYKGRFTSAYRKQPVEKISVTQSDGVLEDEHAYYDHGGEDRGILQYSMLDYARMQQAFPNYATLHEPCAFGENMTTEGPMCSRTVCIGDVYEVGSAVVEVSMPRFPCWKVDHRHGTGTKEYALKNGLSGWFYRVKQPGDISVGDTFKLINRPNPLWTIFYLQNGLHGEDSKLKTDRQFLTDV
ncbi:MOSC domain-containing protein YiiM, variant 2 [Balamuthia mandrillaris]